MKIFKILSIGVLACSVASCSDSEDFNTAGNVSVEMGEATIRISEDQISSASFNYIPVVVKGEANGPIRVNIELTPVGEGGAVSGVNYIMTSTSIIIPEGETTGSFQYYPKGDSEINDDRSFTAKIVSVEGASIGQNNTTEITLVDNEGLIPIYYTGLAGKWNAVYNSMYDGPIQGNPTIEVVNEGETGYGSVVTLKDFPDVGFTTIGNFGIDGVNQIITLSIECGQVIGTFNSASNGLGNVFLAPFSGSSYWNGGTFTLQFNFDLKSGEMLPDADGRALGALIQFAGGVSIYDGYDAIIMSR